ncbi:hypothetical protein ACOMICROBIO_FLGHMIGD_03038 [Vibrio sp. B1FLJ16]|nr:hypothetical protein ACOMICROBIO_FLGHMIGD_03038 [Vibrio sp. B1FLJ16]CAE6949754.1 hypothetical protein ACOMICROBIO_FLGHMIGD_03038 [Vibrio sp. B1FLJ16]
MILENVSQEIELRDNYLVGLTNLGALLSYQVPTVKILYGNLFEDGLVNVRKWHRITDFSRRC